MKKILSIGFALALTLPFFLRKGSSFNTIINKPSGDTIEYKASAFVIQPNDKLQALLRKLPGIDIDKDGRIYAQGDTVKKLLVDGEEFFGDDPTLGSRNLRADIVDVIQIYFKISDQAVFTGVEDKVRIKTINVKLKKQKR
jgi:hypothetical protein